MLTSKPSLSDPPNAAGVMEGSVASCFFRVVLLICAQFFSSIYVHSIVQAGAVRGQEEHKLGKHDDNNNNNTHVSPLLRALQITIISAVSGFRASSNYACYQVPQNHFRDSAKPLATRHRPSRAGPPPASRTSAYLTSNAKAHCYHKCKLTLGPEVHL